MIFLTQSLHEFPTFFLALFKAALKIWASLMDKDIVVTSYK